MEITFYKKGSAASLAAFDPNVVYYRDASNDLKWDDLQMIDMWEPVSAYDPAFEGTYYTYNKITGNYTKCDNPLKSFRNGNIYFRKTQYPTVPCNQTSAPNNRMFIVKGFQEVSYFKPDTKYYKDNSYQNPNTGEHIWQYDVSLFIPKDSWYYIDPVSRLQKIVEEGEYFNRGIEYYKLDSNGTKNSSFFIPYYPLYVDHGRIEVKIKEDEINDPNSTICYVLDANNNPVFLPKGKYMLGKTNYYYKVANNEINMENFQQGSYYAYDGRTNAFISMNVLKKFDMYKTYFSSVDEDYKKVPVGDTIFHGEYFVRIPTSFGMYVYYPWNDVFDFSKHIFKLYVKDLNGSTTGYIGPGLNDFQRFSVVNQASAVYDENTKYYAQLAKDNHFYEVDKKITTSNYKTVPWSLFYQNDVQRFEMCKHIGFKEAGTKIDYTDEHGKTFKISLLKEYSNSPQYETTTKWNVAANTPETLNFWFDFLDTEGELVKYSNPAIGNRPKAENDTAVKAIYYRDTPNVIFVDASAGRNEIIKIKQEKTGHTIIKLNNAVENLFTISSQGKSAQDKLNQMLYNYTYCAESITINALPVYHLNPNYRILVKDDNSGINGEYIITKITVPLTYNGTMNISATKAVERIY